jgi:putative glutamine amidotransferase
MKPEGARIIRNLNTFTKAGADPFVIALSADINLNPSEKNEFYRKISEQFSLLVSLGGDDIFPQLYGEENRFAKNTNLTRDQSELALVKFF